MPRREPSPNTVVADKRGHKSKRNRTSQFSLAHCAAHRKRKAGEGKEENIQRGQRWRPSISPLTAASNSGATPAQSLRALRRCSPPLLLLLPRRRRRRLLLLNHASTGSEHLFVGDLSPRRARCPRRPLSVSPFVLLDTIRLSLRFSRLLMVSLFGTSENGGGTSEYVSRCEVELSWNLMV